MVMKVIKFSLDSNTKHSSYKTKSLSWNRGVLMPSSRRGQSLLAVFLTVHVLHHTACHCFNSGARLCMKNLSFTVENCTFVLPLLLPYHFMDKIILFMFAVTEFVEGGDLSTLWRAHGAFPEEVVKIWGLEIALALDHLHSRGILYRVINQSINQILKSCIYLSIFLQDLKLANTLLTRKGHVKLADFGLAKMLCNAEDRTKTVCGTLNYMAPEILSEEVNTLPILLQIVVGLHFFIFFVDYYSGEIFHHSLFF